MTNSQFTLSDFIVQKVIGEGSYGRAVLCKQISNDKYVVIKEISLKKLTEQEQRDAWKETKVLSLLHHPNIITYYGCFLQNNVLHIVMEYADNGDLSEEIRKSLNNNQHFDEDKILNWFVQICLAIKHLHDRKILHRDLKNQNIFLLKDNTAKLGDFGIAKMLSSTSQMSNTAIGTPYYLSPEICQGKSYNMKSDIWSLGCILYELCTLHHPFDSNCLNGLIVKIQRAKPPPIPYYYSSSLRNLVDKLLQKVPAKRPSINQILDLDFIRCRVPNFLSYAIERKEFCHTILHDFKPGESPEKAKVTSEDVENNNANLHIENKKDDPSNRGNRNRINSRNRNNRQNAYRNIPRYSSNKNINADNRRKINKDEENKSPRLQYRVRSSPQISYNPSPRSQQQNILQSEEESVKSNENENYESNDLSEENLRDSNDFNDDDSYHSNQNLNSENKSNNNKNNQRKSVIRRRRNNDNQSNSPYINPVRNLQAKKNAAVIADRAMVRELREKKAVEDRITQLKNEEKRREVQEKAKERELQRKEQMRRLKQEEKERQEKYKKLKPTFKIDRNVHYHNNTDSESNGSISDFENDEKRAERIKKRKEEELKKENLKRNATVIAEKMKNNNQIQSTPLDSNYEDNESDLNYNESDSNPKKKRENNISALREFLHQRRSEIRKNKQQEDVIMIGNMRYYVNNNNNKSNQVDDSNKVDDSKNNKKQIESEVYGLIFDNYKNNDDVNANNSDEITKTEIENNFESYSSEQLLTSDSNKNSTPQKNNSLLSSNSNENSPIKNELNTEEPSYLASSFESNNDDFKSSSPDNNNNNNNNDNSNPENNSAIFASQASINSISDDQNPTNANCGSVKNNIIKNGSAGSINNNNNNMDDLNSNIIYASPSKNSVKFASSSSTNVNNLSPTNTNYSNNNNNIKYSSSGSTNFNNLSPTNVNYGSSNGNNKYSSSGSTNFNNLSPTNANYGNSNNNIKYSSSGSTNINNLSPANANYGNSNNNIKYSSSGSTNFNNLSPTNINYGNNNNNIKYSSSGSTNINNKMSPNENIIYASPSNSSSIKFVSPSIMNSNHNSASSSSVTNCLSPSNINYGIPSTVNYNSSSPNNDIVYANQIRSVNSNINYASPVARGSNNASPVTFSFNSNSPSSFKEKGENVGQMKPFVISGNSESSSDPNYQKVAANSNGEQTRSPVESKSMRTPSSDYEYSPIHYFEKVRSESGSYGSSSPLKSNDSDEAELKSPVSSTSPKNDNSEFNENDKKDDEKGLKISSRQTTTVSSGLCVYSPINALTQNEKSKEVIQNNEIDNKRENINNLQIMDGSSAINHKNTIIMQIDKLLNDSLSNSANIDDETEETKKTQSFSPIKPEDNKKEDQNNEICISAHNEKEDNNNDGIFVLNAADSDPRKPFFSNNYNFTFRGSELRFDNIRSNDSLAYKIETVRKFIEDSLGIEKTIKAYRLAEENNFSNYKEVLTTPDQQSFYPLIMQLVSSEEILLAKWIK